MFDKKRKIKSKTGIEYASRVLAKKDYSEKELKKKIAGHFGEEEAEQTVDRLKEYNYLDDGRYREMFIASRIRSGNGAYRIKRELSEKGLNDSLEDLDEICQRSNIDRHGILRDCVQRYLDKKSSIEPYKLKQKCIAYFYGKGHSIDDVKRIIDEEFD
jgi:regulatory protein